MFGIQKPVKAIHCQEDIRYGDYMVHLEDFSAFVSHSCQHVGHYLKFTVY